MLQVTSDAIAVAKLARALLDNGLFVPAFDLLRRARDQHPGDVVLTQLLARALDRTGATADARALLLAEVDAERSDAETLGILAGACKRLGRLEEAYEYYRAGFEGDAYYPGINAASLAHMLGRGDDARRLAGDVRQICMRLLAAPGGDAHWLHATLGEAAWLLGDMDAAAAHYGDAAAEAGIGPIASMRAQLRWLGVDAARIDAWIPARPIAAFSGHMIDAPDRAESRFAPDDEDTVAQCLYDTLQSLKPVAGYASAACGSDILFHEALHQLGIDSHVILPFPPEAFRATSVERGLAGDWGARFDAVLNAAADVQVVSTHVPRDASVGYSYTNQVLLGTAMLHAARLETHVKPLAVWDGRESGLRGGTDEFVRLCTQRGLEVQPVCITCETSPMSTDSDRKADVGATAAILFADVAGFSKLDEAQVSRFVERYLGRMAEVIDADDAEAMVCNTWGDGLLLVYDDIRAAGRVALALSAAMVDFDFAGAGLPDHMALRVALHAGPLLTVTDPVTKRMNVAGSHISQAARIEPITPKGQVYASQAFAALAQARGEESLDFVYVGRTALAKGYGKFPLYHVRSHVRGHVRGR